MSPSVSTVPSVPLSIPSPSQSADDHVVLGVNVTLATKNSQLLFGSVLSKTSCPSVTPSPSESGFNGSVLSPVVAGSPSCPFTSSKFVNPSVSQSALFQAASGVNV